MRGQQKEIPYLKYVRPEHSMIFWKVLQILISQKSFLEIENGKKKFLYLYNFYRAKLSTWTICNICKVKSLIVDKYQCNNSQTCVPRPTVGPQICGRCWQVDNVQRYLYVVRLKNPKWWSLFGGGRWLSFDCILLWFCKIIQKKTLKMFQKKY